MLLEIIYVACLFILVSVAVYISICVAAWVASLFEKDESERYEEYWRNKE